MEKPKFSLSEVYQNIDLDEFGLNIKSKDDKEHLAELVIKKIQDRTATGKSFYGREFKPYSPQYVNSLEFKAYGKSKGKINMRLSGDMLELIDVLNVKGNTIKIGYDDDLQIKKAFNHNTGDTLPKRPFFGVTKKEMQEIINQFKKEIGEDDL